MKRFKNAFGLASVPSRGTRCGLGALRSLVAAWSLVASMLVFPSRAEEPVSTAPLPPTVVLISLDGTRPADVTEALLPSLVELGRKGTRARALVPVDPSNTFPNHVSLVTGVRPDEHRLVNNAFIDPERGRFSRDEPHAWVESEPIWSIAERHGLPTASFHWVGSEGPWRGGPGPRETRKFSSRTREKTKVNQILKWLAIRDPEKRPRLITCWFHGADHAAHSSGPGTPDVAKSLAPQDAQIARLIREMEARNLFESTTLIFVSDHGMVAADVRVDLGNRFRQAGLEASVLGIGGFSSAYFDEGKGTSEAIAQAVRIARDAGLMAWPRSEAPADWHVDDVRFGDVVIRAPIGTAIVGPTTFIDGFHGYDAREPSMAGVLVARGRGVRVGATIESVSNLAIAPTVLRLLGLPIPAQMKMPPIAEMVDTVEPVRAGAGATP